MFEDAFLDLEIEALSDDALEAVAGGKSSTDGNSCCSCQTCSDDGTPIDVGPGFG
ncbi:MAG: hypothetical protein AAFX50_08135 [Acidobacteriota bacterium]